MNIIDYKIVFSFEGKDKLEQLVRECIMDKWQPSGGVAITQIQMPFEEAPSTYFMQTMVKYSDL